MGVRLRFSTPAKDGPVKVVDCRGGSGKCGFEFGRKGDEEHELWYVTGRNPVYSYKECREDLTLIIQHNKYFRNTTT